MVRRFEMEVFGKRDSFERGERIEMLKTRTCVGLHPSFQGSRFSVGNLFIPHSLLWNRNKVSRGFSVRIIN